MLTRAQYEKRLLPSEVLNGLALPGDVVAQIGSQNYAQFRAPERQPAASTRAVDWSHMGFAAPRSPAWERLLFVA